MKTTTLLIGALTAVLLLAPVAAATGEDLTQTGYRLIGAYWKQLDAWYQVEEYPFEKGLETASVSEIGHLEQVYVEAARRYRSLCEEMAATVIASMQKGDLRFFLQLSGFYKELEIG